MKRLLWSFVFIFVVMSWVPSVFAQKGGISGYWKTVDDKTGKVTSIVRIWEYEGKLVGRIVKLYLDPDEDQNPKCDKCSGSLRNKPVSGMIFLWGFVPDNSSKDKWVDGSIVDPNDGGQYHCQLELIDNGKKLEVFGYIRMLFKIGRSQVWLRTSDREVASLR
jgi:uncharacterized protein (DUF2147 family)